MFFKISVLAAFLAAAVSAGAQEPSGDQLSARELYYKESADQDKLPPVASAKPAPGKPAKVSRHKESPPPPPPPANPGAMSQQSVSYSPPVPVVEHLGLRYRLLLIDKESMKPKPVSVDTVFHKGDCLALELRPNRTGYLYVIAKEANGNWNFLFPNAAMSDESEIVYGQKTQRSPQNSCFELDENTGEEHLFVILSRNPQQAHNLNTALENSDPAPKADAPAKDPDSLIADAAKFNAQANGELIQMASRGFKITKLGNAETSEEKYAVFVVPAALEKKDAVFADIRIKHQ